MSDFFANSFNRFDTLGSQCHGAPLFGGRQRECGLKRSLGTEIAAVKLVFDILYSPSWDESSLLNQYHNIVKSKSDKLVAMELK